MSPKARNVLLFALVLLAAAFATRRLADVPPGLHLDEIVSGYEAHCVAETGRDCHGAEHPAAIRGAHAPREPLFIYFLSLVDRLWPLAPAAMRAANVFIFLLAGLALFVLVRAWDGDASAFFAALAFSVMPWAIMPARMAIRPLSMLPLLLIALYFSTVFRRSERAWHAVLSGLFAGLSLYAYTPRVFFAPVIVLATLAVAWRARPASARRYAAFALPVFLLVALPLLAAFFPATIR
ncbi:MAG: hypothetical protein M5R36_06740 [Deltaproteobacteria bacterium]|nr:hypothetical protein [Deltaproteobacteria bacterium]